MSIFVSSQSYSEKKLASQSLYSSTDELGGHHLQPPGSPSAARLRGAPPLTASIHWVAVADGRAGARREPRPGAAPEPSKVRRLAENWHSAPIIEDNEQPHPLLSEDHLAAVAKRPEPPKPVTDDDDSTHPLLDASRDTLASRVSSETQSAPPEPEIVVVSAPPDIVNISISGESLSADTPEPDEAEPPPPPPPPPLVFESPERPVPPAVAPVAPPRASRAR